MGAWLDSLADTLRFTRRRLLVGVEALEPEDWGFQPVPTLMSPREQIVHVAWAEHAWRSRCTGEAPPSGRWADRPELARDGLIALLAEQRAITETWLAGLSDADLTRPITDRDGRPLTVVWVLQHLARHDAHHAGQILTLWRMRHPDQPIASGYASIVDGLTAES